MWHIPTSIDALTRRSDCERCGRTWHRHRKTELEVLVRCPDGADDGSPRANALGASGGRVDSYDRDDIRRTRGPLKVLGDGTLRAYVSSNIPLLADLELESAVLHGSGRADLHLVRAVAEGSVLRADDGAKIDRYGIRLSGVLDVAPGHEERSE